MKNIKKIVIFILLTLCSITVVLAATRKQDSKAADFTPDILLKTKDEQKDKNNQLFFDPFKQETGLPKNQNYGITPRIGAQLVQYGSFRLTGDSRQDVNGKNSVHLEWAAVPDLLDGYVVERTLNSSATVWDNPPVNYGKHVTILNIYPNNSNYLKSWMDQIDPNTGQPVSMGLISVDAVSLTEFNKNPDYYLKKGTSSYQYDGIYFGSEDVNGGYTPGEHDLTASSQPVVAAFGATGRSVIFGHDTIMGEGHPYFNTFAGSLGIILKNAIPAGYTTDGVVNNIGSNKVKFTMTGTLNQFPYKLDPNAIYNIQPAHTVGQFYIYNSGGKRWMQFAPPISQNGMGDQIYSDYNHLYNNGTLVGDNNSYLVTKNNYAQIQTGHTTGSCSPDEAKIIANMIYYTTTLTMNSPGDDYTVKDVTAPTTPVVAGNSSTGDQVSLTLNAQDNPTDYFYRVKARTASSTQYSDVIKSSVLSGFKGYVYQMDSNPTGSPVINRDPNTGNITNINLNPVSSTNNQGTITLNRSAAVGKYLHIVAVDKENNVSAVKTVNLSDYFWWNVDSNNVLTIYPHELNFDVDHVSYVDVDGKVVSDWPWYQKDSQIVKTVISPGVTAKNSLFGLFSRMSAMTSIEGLTQLDTSQVTNMGSMFSQCSSLPAVDVTHFNTSKVTDMSSMFSYCSQLPNLDVTHFDTSKVETMSAMFKECNNLTNLDVTNFDTSKVTNMAAMFTSCKKLTSLDVTHFNTTQVTDMSLMFFECSLLPTINLSSFVTSNVLDMHSMFGFSTALTSLDLKNFDTSKVTSMSGMFYYCRSLTDLKMDPVKFDTSQVTAMDNMFNRCTVLPVIDVSFFKTGNVTNMNGMFGSCAEITRLNVSNFDTEKVANFNSMFSGCSKLTSLDLTKFNTKRVYSSYRKGMLTNTPKLWKLTFGPNFILEDYVSTDMLSNPSVGAAINDVDNPTPVYYVTNPQWREVGAGSPHEPKGAEATVTKMMNESSIRTDTRTYVWDQVGTQTLAATPGSIDLGTHAGYLKNQEYVSTAQNIRKTDNRNSNISKQWHIEAAVTKPFTLTTDSTKVIRGNPLYYHDTTAGTTTHLTPTGQTIYSGTRSNNQPDTKNYPWTLSFKASPSDIPKAGRYSATVTFSLVNDTP
ncbi:BspA family leucine-rich repeat surface protein [Xylocopilactobacillus apis]|uniref:Surface protein n=1 Tax=Xylocopilactobacillus apis TaxID=2932183 RepID=A0AAU9CNG9_9LACO|nr:BspA family leucine-rich repeat surface protein [Xylocopilactobacillus apis]BDR55492.1 hypothetical protein KIMC2_00540 [Xylocopilactobacillus apis]